MTREVERHPLIQGLMSQAYDRWQSNDAMAREYTPLERDNYWGKDDFWEQLEDQERLAVAVGNLNYQVENGGFLQWSMLGNSYGTPETVRFLMDATTRINGPACRTVHELIDAFKQLRITSDRSMSEERYERVMKLTGPMDSLFYTCNDNFLDEVEAWLKEGKC